MLEVGQVLENRYRINAVLGQGGMGSVYRAYDLTLSIDCVVKELTITPEVLKNQSDATGQFEREAKTLASLRHPGLPRVSNYFTGQVGSGYYLVMDLVEGRSLDKLIPANGLPEATVLNYADQLLDVLVYIHGRGVLHRDIKPANIIIQPDGRVMLVDFGLVKVTRGGSAQSTVTFLRGVGTPEYAPPEQYTGGTDQRTDLYSLAGTLYHALTGHMPPMAIDLSTGAKRLASLRQWNPNISLNTDQVIMRAMSLKRDDRYPDAASMRAALLGSSAPGMEAQPVTAPQVEMTTQVPASRPITGSQVPIATPGSRLPSQSMTPTHRDSALLFVAGALALIVVAALVVVFLVRGGSQDASSPTPNVSRGTQQVTTSATGIADATDIEAPTATPADDNVVTVTPAEDLTAVPTQDNSGNAQPTPVKTSQPTAPPGGIKPNKDNSLAFDGSGRLRRIGKGRLSQIAWSLDGRWLVAASALSLFIYDGASYDQVRYIPGDRPLSGVTLSPDGKVAASLESGRVRRWNTGNGSSIGSAASLDGSIVDLAFRPDGKLLAETFKRTSNLSATVKIVDVAGNKTITSFGVDSSIRNLGLSQDGKLAFYTLKDILWLIDVGGSPPRSFTVGDNAFGVAVSPDDKQVALAIADTVKLFDIASGTQVQTYSDHTNTIASLAFSPDSKQIAVAVRSGTIYLYDVAGGALLRTITNGDDGVYSMAFSSDGKLLGTAGSAIRLWDVASGSLARTLAGYASAINTTAFSPGNDTLAVGEALTGTIRLVDASNGNVSRVLVGHTSGVLSVAYSPNGKLIASGSNDETARLWDSASGTPLYTLGGHTCGVYSVAFSPDGKRLATASCDKTIRIWDTNSGTQLLTLGGHSDAVLSVAFSPNGKLIVSGSVDKTVRIWDAASGNLVRTLSGHNNSVRGVVFSPDSKWVASASYDGSVKQWDVAGGSLIRSIDAKSGALASIDISPDGKWIATGGSDGNVKVWNASSGSRVRTQSGHYSTVSGVAFSSDSATLVSCSYDGTIRIWDES